MELFAPFFIFNFQFNKSCYENTCNYFLNDLCFF